MTSTDPLARIDAVRNRASLLDAAAEVLAVTPQATLAEVAARAGLGRATLYRHFESREALIDAIRSEALARVGEALAELDLDSCDTREAIRLVGSTLIPLGMRFRILLAEGVDADPEFLARRDVTLAPLWGVLRTGVERGELGAPDDPAWMNVALAGLLASAVRAASLGLIETERAGQLLADTFLTGFGNP